ncbi:MAG: gamma-glutamylcysteine synthetase [Desulfuromonas sp.]|nr:MAG: gamma-glutamylcysteine synthetase [Desulfuromonas sp.]
MSTLAKTELNAPITGRQDLLEYLLAGARPRPDWGVGVESEKLVVDAVTGEAADHVQIGRLLETLAATGDWREIREDGYLMALFGKHSSITLEPGGQLEHSGRFCPDLHCSAGDLQEHIHTILQTGESLGLAFLGLGVQPFTPLEKIDWLPKKRYGIMGPYMMRTGDMGQRMMKQSAGLQVNFDFADETDGVEKLRLCFALSPLLYALFANSPFMDGKPSGFLSSRGEIWARTDADRCGLITELLKDGASFTTYVEYALDVPMYFIIRDGGLIDLTRDRLTFRRYMSEGFEGIEPTLTDWDLHLSTLFPEARLRPQIEVRSADALPPNLTLAMAALLKGVLYDAEAMSATWDLFRDMDLDEHLLSYRQSWRKGLQAPSGKRTLQDLALQVLDLSASGLKRQAAVSQHGLDETIFLDGVNEIAHSGITLAEKLLSLWTGDRKKDLAMLRDHCGFRIN